ncbi:DUF2164 domain-containing protein [Marinomonas epiphytica]
MAKIELDSATKEKMVDKLKEYLEQELDTQIGTFEGEFLLDFITEHFAAPFYNQGLADAQQALMAKVESINDDIYGLEMAEKLD